METKAGVLKWHCAIFGVLCDNKKKINMWRSRGVISSWIESDATPRLCLLTLSCFYRLFTKLRQRCVHVHTVHLRPSPRPWEHPSPHLPHKQWEVTAPLSDEMTESGTKRWAEVTGGAGAEWWKWEECEHLVLRRLSVSVAGCAQQRHL